MNTEQISSYVMRYLEAMTCDIMEKTPAYVTVKLSEAADRALTNRPYYWGFIERTGAEYETMRFTFVFDPANMPPDQNRGPVSYVTAGIPPVTANNAVGDAAIQRAFGVAPGFNGGGGVGRIPRDNVDFGSRRLSQIMEAAKEGGRFLSLYESLDPASDVRYIRGRHSVAYEPWIMLNIKLEFACDLKREEVHSLGFSLISGAIHTNFMDKMVQRSLSPKLPPQVHTMTWRYTLEQAVNAIEEAIKEHVRNTDETWAVEASERLEDEWDRLAAYYEPLLQEEAEKLVNQQTEGMDAVTFDVNDNESEPQSEQEAKLMSIREQYDMRCKEIQWQFEPRIEMNVINAAIVYLSSDKFIL